MTVITIAGSPSDFGPVQRKDFRQGIATMVGVALDAVSIKVSAGSTIVDVTIDMPGMPGTKTPRCTSSAGSTPGSTPRSRISTPREVSKRASKMLQERYWTPQKGS
mgnify:CR=1 FL=1